MLSWKSGWLNWEGNIWNTSSKIEADNPWMNSDDETLLSCGIEDCKEIVRDLWSRVIDTLCTPTSYSVNKQFTWPQITFSLKSKVSEAYHIAKYAANKLLDEDRK